jgi:hypothetical protein
MTESNKNPTPARPMVPPFRGPVRAGRPAAVTTPGREGFRPFVPPRSAERRFAQPRPRAEEQRVASARPTAKPGVAEPPWLALPGDDNGEPGAAPETVEAADAMLASQAIGAPAPADGPSEAQRRQSFAAAIAAAESFGATPTAQAATTSTALSLAAAAQALSAAIASGDLATFGAAMGLAPPTGAQPGRPSAGGEAVAAQLEALAERIRAGALDVHLPTGPVTDPAALVAALAALFDVRS